jgi:hypothetical protein
VSDLVERLRARAERIRGLGFEGDAGALDCDQAADEITRLRSENERLTGENAATDAELDHYIKLACVDPGANSRVFWIDRASAAEAEVAKLRAALTDPTEEQLIAARDWSIGMYGKAIGNDAAIGCWRAMASALSQASDKEETR